MHVKSLKKANRNMTRLVVVESQILVESVPMGRLFNASLSQFANENTSDTLLKVSTGKEQFNVQV